jgi:hypothetical protein
MSALSPGPVPPWRALALAVVLLFGITGRAATPIDGAPDAGVPDAVTGSNPEIPPKRPLPDYEGRDRESTATEDALLFVPRLVLFPVYLVTEYAVAYRWERSPALPSETSGRRRFTTPSPSARTAREESIRPS